MAATDALKTLTGRARDVDCYDPASRREAKAHWTAVVATLQRLVFTLLLDGTYRNTSYASTKDGRAEVVKCAV